MSTTTTSSSGHGPLHHVKNAVPNSECGNILGELLRPFLFPLIIDYSLLTGSMYFKMLQRVGPVPSIPCPSSPDGSICSHNNNNNNNTANNNSINSSNNQGFHRIFSYASMTSQDRSPTFISLPSDLLSAGGESREAVCRKHMKYRSILGCRVYMVPTLEEEEEIKLRGTVTTLCHIRFYLSIAINWLRY